MDDSEMLNSTQDADIASQLPERASPPRLESIPVSVPNGTPPATEKPLMGVKMAEESDVSMGEPVAEPVPVVSVLATLAAAAIEPKLRSRETTPTPAKLSLQTVDVSLPSSVSWPVAGAADEADDSQSEDSDRPTKRARVNSEGDVSMHTQSVSSATPPPLSHPTDGNDWPSAAMDITQPSEVISTSNGNHVATNGHHETNGAAKEPIDSPIGAEVNGMNGTPSPTLPNGTPDMNGAINSPVLNGADSSTSVKLDHMEGDGEFSSSIMATGETEHVFTDTALGPAQYRFCQSTVKTLKKLKDAAPFLRPVDPIALNIPHYPSIITNPMDFGTIERKLASSNPGKPDPNPLNPKYNTADEFIIDVRLVFHNCLTFNGPDHLVTQMSKRVEEVFDKQIKNMPAADAKLSISKKENSFTPPPGSAGPKKPQRKQSTSVPTIRRSDSISAVRPKREIHPPPPRDLPYNEAPPKKTVRPKVLKQSGSASAGGSRSTTQEQLRFCAKVLEQLHRKSHMNIASPFYEPVDWVALDLPNYPKIVKRPMDLSTMRKRLESGEYPGPQKFYDDFKLMIRNCFAFNPPGTPVNQAGVELQRLFDEKWKGLPLTDDDVMSDEEEYEEEDEAGDQEDEAERLRAIELLENQMANIRGNLAALKQQKPAAQSPIVRKAPPPKPPKEKKRKINDLYAPSSSKASKSGIKKKNGKKAITDDDVLSFEQKKELSEAIAELDGTKLERVIQIIHEGVPEIRDSTEEIELEIDLLPAAVLTKLYNFVLRPIKTAGQPKRSRIPKGTGTGGLKRKSMDEDVEAEKIRVLEERMRAFERAEAGASGPLGGDESASSDSSDGDSDSSDDSD